MNHQLPSKLEFMKELSTIPQATEANKTLISTVYDFSLKHHLHAPVRLTGEHYFWHIFRATMRALSVFKQLGIWDVKIILILLLHDVIEDAKKAGFDPELVCKKIVKQFTEEIAYGILAISRQEGERSYEMLIRLIHQHYWRSIVAKAFDREDNLWTLHGMEKVDQHRKLSETEKYFTSLFNRLEVEIHLGVQAKRLHRNWLKLTPLLRARQALLIKENKQQLAMTNKP